MKEYSVDVLVTNKHNIRIAGNDESDAMRKAEKHIRECPDATFIETVSVEAIDAEVYELEKDRDDE